MAEKQIPVRQGGVCWFVGIMVTNKFPSFLWISLQISMVLSLHQCIPVQDLSVHCCTVIKTKVEFGKFLKIRCATIWTSSWSWLRLNENYQEGGLMGLHYTRLNETVANITTTTTSKTVEGLEGVRMMMQLWLMMMGEGQNMSKHSYFPSEWYCWPMPFYIQSPKLSEANQGAGHPPLRHRNISLLLPHLSRWRIISTITTILMMAVDPVAVTYKLCLSAPSLSALSASASAS